MDGIKYWIELEGKGHWFFAAFPICLLALLIWFKGRRVRFLIPSLIISIVIINPWFYKAWDELGLYAYWRILWTVPVIPMVVVLVPSITERIDKTWIKAVVVASGVGLLISGGTFLYNGAGGSFIEAANAAKLPDYVVQVADRLLELDEHPRVIAQDPIGVYIRQYTAKIDILYGRDLYGYITGNPRSNATLIQNELSNPEGDIQITIQTMIEDGYDYLVTKQVFERSELKLLDRIGDYNIFRNVSVPTVIKQRNENGQVTKVMIYDDDGVLTNDSNGYAIIEYAYDQYGYVSFEFHKNAEGMAVLDNNGRAGYERSYDEAGHIVRELNLGNNSEPVLCKLGYAEVRRKYVGEKLLLEEYFDINGEPLNSINGYARRECQYDGRGNMILERFVDSDNRLVITNAGYAVKRCEYSGNKLVYEEYFGDDDSSLIQQAGHAAYKQIWDGDNLISRIYLDPNRNPINRTDGFSRVAWSEGTTISKDVSFYDIEDKKIDIKGINLVRDVRFGLDGWSEWMTPTFDTTNCCYYIGKATLGEKRVGDVYTVQCEIEFSNVTSTMNEKFLFCTLGETDNSWELSSPWSQLLWTESVPENGCIKLSTKWVVDENNVKSCEINIGFRCDNWSSGRFRVRNLCITKGEYSEKWYPGL